MTEIIELPVSHDPAGMTPHEVRAVTLVREKEEPGGPSTLYEKKTVEELFELVLNGAVPRHRPLKVGEPETLSVQHLQWILLRSQGFRPGKIVDLETQAGREVTLNRVSVVLHHPDAEWLLSRLTSYRAEEEIRTTAQWLADISGEMQSILLHHARNVAKPELSQRTALELLKMRYGSEQKEKPQLHEHRLAPGEISRLTQALARSNELREIGYNRTEFSAGAAGGHTALPALAEGLGQPPSQAPAVVGSLHVLRRPDDSETEIL